MSKLLVVGGPADGRQVDRHPGPGPVINIQALDDPGVAPSPMDLNLESPVPSITAGRYREVVLSVQEYSNPGREPAPKALIYVSAGMSLDELVDRLTAPRPTRCKVCGSDV